MASAGVENGIATHDHIDRARSYELLAKAWQEV